MTPDQDDPSDPGDLSDRRDLPDEPDDARLGQEVDALLSQLFAETGPSSAPGLGGLLGLLATADHAPFEVDRGQVVFDADGDPALVGVRAAGMLEGQQLVVEAGELTVVLDVIGPDADRGAGTAGDGPEERGAGRLVRGEVLGTDEVLSVQLLDGVVEIALAVTDALGEFSFGDVPPGTYELIVAGGRREVSATVTVH